MDKGRMALAMWRSGAGKPEKAEPAGHAGNLRLIARMDPAHDPARGAESKASRWPRESAPVWSEDGLIRKKASRKPPEAPQAHGAQRIIRPWSELLERALAMEVLPRLIEARRAADMQLPEAAPDAGDLGAFTDFILADDMTGARALVQDILRRSIGRAALLDDLFAPAARRLGVLWEQDICDFAAVTRGILHLDQLMHEIDGDEATGPAAGGRPAGGHAIAGHDRRALLIPVPGERHDFGVNMVSEVFRRDGWHVWSGKAASRPELLRLVRREAFHVIGFSVATRRLVGLMPSCIRAVRQASRNPQIRVLVGGKYFLDNPGEAAAIGADAMARDARDALSCANGLVLEKGSVDRQGSS